jgi:NADP-dependent 3-hydroxy acid dehydrogenase YdfG
MTSAAVAAVTAPNARIYSEEESMAPTLAGRVALVTGSSSGIGEGAALALAAAGASVALSARRAGRLTALADKITASGGTAIALPGDAADETVAQDVVRKTLERFGRIDILVNSAGIIQPGRIEDADTAQWRRVIDVNLLATLHTCSAVIGGMRAQGGGDIINISSTAGRRRAGGPYAPYSVSKYGVTALTEHLRQEVCGHGIRVCIIEPGATTTEVSEGISDENIRQWMRQHVQKPGAMKPEDIADAILFVLSLPPRVNVSEILIRPTIDVGPM